MKNELQIKTKFSEELQNKVVSLSDEIKSLKENEQKLKLEMQRIVQEKENELKLKENNINQLNRDIQSLLSSLNEKNDIIKNLNFEFSKVEYTVTQKENR